jgi:hypothetical protein
MIDFYSIITLRKHWLPSVAYAIAAHLNGMVYRLQFPPRNLHIMFFPEVPYPFLHFLHIIKYVLLSSISPTNFPDFNELICKLLHRVFALHTCPLDNQE